MKLFSLVLVVVSLSSASYCLSFTQQPICRDLKAPFEHKNAAYCPEYGGFGCCGKRGERRAEKWAANAQLKLETAEEREICNEYTRNVSCLTCSPLAGRIFRADESPRIPLCRDYCVEMYTKCRFSLLRLFKLHPWRNNTISKFPKSEETLERDAEVFCDRYASEQPTCYPAVTAMERQVTVPAELKRNDCVCITPIATGVLQPRGATFSGHRKSGKIYVIEARNVVVFDRASSTLLPEPFINMTRVLDGRDYIAINQMQGFTLHPNFDINGRVFLFYTLILNSTAGLYSVNITEFRTRNINQVDYSSQRLIFSTTYKMLTSQFHLHGGGLFFKDGLLYIALGKTAESEKIFNLSTYDGKMLRIDVDSRSTERPYGIPQDNPYVNNPTARPEIFASGFAQPWRCSVDRGDPKTGAGAGRILCGDISQENVIEEINLVESGKNYGYPLFEGTTCLLDNQTCNSVAGGVSSPLYDYPHTTPPPDVSVIGGYYYRGCLFPNLQGLYIYAHFTGGLQILRETEGGYESHSLCVGDEDICPGASNVPFFYSSFGEDEGGELYLVGYDPPFSATNGAVYQITEPLRRRDPQTCKRSRQFTPVY